jgi:DNA-binding NarL/FixJ family response regulator
MLRSGRSFGDLGFRPRGQLLWHGAEYSRAMDLHGFSTTRGCAGKVELMAVRILLVDDHPIVRQGLRTLLEGRPGWEIVGEASDGVEALDKVESLQPDVVVLDVTMPRMNGLEACRLIQQKRQKASGLEVLFVTQHDSPQMMREALDAGARGYVVKSNAARDLLQAVEAVSQHRVFTALARSPQASF